MHCKLWTGMDASSCANAAVTQLVPSPSRGRAAYACQPRPGGGRSSRRGLNEPEPVARVSSSRLGRSLTGEAGPSSHHVESLRGLSQSCVCWLMQTSTPRPDRPRLCGRCTCVVRGAISVPSTTSDGARDTAGRRNAWRLRLGKSTLQRRFGMVISSNGHNEDSRTKDRRASGSRCSESNPQERERLVR
jgi:hypothetical protein